MRPVVGRPIPVPGEESDVEAELSDRGDMLVGIAVDQLDPDIAMPKAVGMQQIG